MKQSNVTTKNGTTKTTITPGTKAEERRNAARAKAQHREISKLASLRLISLSPDQALDYLFAGVTLDECDNELVDQLAFFLMRWPEARKSFLEKHKDFRAPLVERVMGE